MDSKNARAHFGLESSLWQGQTESGSCRNSTGRSNWIRRSRSIAFTQAKPGASTKTIRNSENNLKNICELNPNDEDRVDGSQSRTRNAQSFRYRGQWASSTRPRNPGPIQFRKSLNLIFASVKINGKGPYDFAIDTGATQTVLSEKLAAEVGLPPITSTVVFGIGGAGKVETKLYKVKELTIGDDEGEERLRSARSTIR